MIALGREALRTPLPRTSAEVHTMRNEHIGTSVVEPEVFGPMIAYHRSGDFELDINDEDFTGLLEGDMAE